eukprot:883113-Alexandrium_andersonii.AAC.1
MSASLVGSEMCIRDSYRPPPDAGPVATWLHGMPYRGRDTCSFCGRQLDCLLYTSDAADDM